MEVSWVPTSIRGLQGNLQQDSQETMHFINTDLAPQEAMPIPTGIGNIGVFDKIFIIPVTI
jgi:hypothetical protein